MSDASIEPIEILRERPAPGGLAFDVRVGPHARRQVELRLNWADYNLWSPDGADPPERIAAAVAREALLRYGTTPLPDPLDAARLRRQWPDADSAIAARLRPGGA